MNIVLTIVNPTYSLPQTQSIKRRILRFFDQKKIVYQSIDDLNLERSFDVYFAFEQKKNKELIISYLKKQEVDYCWQWRRVRKKKVLFSDMDGTVIENETFNDLGKILGLKKTIDEITYLGMNGKIQFRDSLRRRVAILKGISTIGIWKQLEKKIVFHPGVFSLVKTAKKHGVKMILLTSGFDPIATYVKKKIGFDAVFNNHYQIKKNRFTGLLEGEMILPQTKKKLMLNFLREKNYKRHQTVAIGDAMNDVGMLTTAGLGVAYYGVEQLKKIIECQINYSDLTSILYFQGYKQKEIL